jgi:hypothetical protein
MLQIIVTLNLVVRCTPAAPGSIPFFKVRLGYTIDLETSSG